MPLNWLSVAPRGVALETTFHLAPFQRSMSAAPSPLWRVPAAKQFFGPVHDTDVSAFDWSFPTFGLGTAFHLPPTMRCATA